MNVVYSVCLLYSVSSDIVHFCHVNVIISQSVNQSVNHFNTHHSHPSLNTHIHHSSLTHESSTAPTAISHHPLLLRLQLYDIPHPIPIAGIYHNELVQVLIQTTNIFSSFNSHSITLQMKIAKDDLNTIECPKDTVFLSLSPIP